jgi:hypothetical protein
MNKGHTFEAKRINCVGLVINNHQLLGFSFEKSNNNRVGGALAPTVPLESRECTLYVMILFLLPSASVGHRRPCRGCGKALFRSYSLRPQQVSTSGSGLWGLKPLLR